VVRIKAALLRLTIALLFLNSGLASWASNTHKNVLVLFSGRIDLRANTIVDREIRSKLGQELGANVGIFSEDMEPTSLGEQQSLLAMRDYIHRKYAQIHFDAVIAVSGMAIRFVQIYRAELFPAIPVVVCCDEYEQKDFSRRQPVTGVAGKIAVGDTVDFILRLHPQTRQVFVISDESPRGQRFEAIARKQLHAYGNRLTIIYLSGLPTAELLKKVADLPRASVILFLGMFEDDAGKQLSGLETLAQMVRVANAPVYGIETTHLEGGIIGGVLFDPRALASETADVAIRLLRGGRVEDMPLRESGSTVPMINWRELQRWGVSERHLPVGTIVLYREPEFWQRNRFYILTALSIFVAQLLLILWLLIEMHSRRLAESNLKDVSRYLISTAEQERRRVARELHDDVNQKMALLSIELDRLQSDSTFLHSTFKERLANLLRGAHEISSDISRVSHELHSSALEFLGLVPALRRLCRDFSEHHNTRVNFTATELPAQASSELSLCLFRITQECLTNVARHSGASWVDVRLTNEGANALQLTIVDDGRGFDASRLDEKGGLGIVSMRERLRLVGGQLTLRTAPAEGTYLAAWAPLPRLTAVNEEAPHAHATDPPISLKTRLRKIS
jgi:signal transduction histidine kinase